MHAATHENMHTVEGHGVLVWRLCPVAQRARNALAAAKRERDAKEREVEAGRAQVRHTQGARTVTRIMRSMHVLCIGS